GTRPRLAWSGDLRGWSQSPLERPSWPCGCCAASQSTPCRASHVPAHELEAWKRVFLDHGARGLKTRVDPEERELTLARAKVGELTMRLELAEHLIEKRASWTTGRVSAMRDTVSPGTGCRYPLTMICRCGGSRSPVSLDGRSTGVASPTQFGPIAPSDRRRSLDACSVSL